MRRAVVAGGRVMVGPTNAVPMNTELAASRQPLLTNDEFTAALRSALRDFNRPDLLARNPLLQARLLTGSDVAGPAELRALVSETVSTLFASGRDDKIRRALELTYFESAPKQEVVADRLGLAFGTYRRHLTAGHKRLADWLWQKESAARELEPADAAPRTTVSVAEETTASLARRLSIVVLPFRNLSENAANDYLVDGVVNNLITSLSRAFPGNFVISQSTAFTYRHRSISARQVGQELGVRYVLEGGILAQAAHVGVNAQLIDAETDETLWAERFDKDRKDLFQVQEEIVARLSRSVGLQMISSEAQRSASSHDSIDLAMRGQALANDIRRAEHAARAVELFGQALELDPHNVDALVGIASTRVFQVLNLYVLDEREALLDEAERMMSRAMALAPDHVGLLRARSAVLRARGRFAEAVVAAATLVARNPGEPTAYRELGLNKLYLGETEAAVEWFRRADRIAPRDPHRWTWLQGLGRALMQLGRDAEAVDTLREALANNPGYHRVRALLAAAEALHGEAENGRRSMAEFMAVEPAMTIRKFMEQRSHVPLHAVNAGYLQENERIGHGLALAGMPIGEGPLPASDAPHSTAQAATQRRRESEAPRLSIVVLPFVNLGRDEDRYFADGLTESLTTDLSRIPDAFVIARATAVFYKDKALDLRQLGRELGVRYVLEGSIQGGTDRVRINAQLLDAESGAHIWAERFDKPRTDLFDMQDEVTTRLARLVGVELVAAESKRAQQQPGYGDATDLAMRGRAVLNGDVSARAARTARRFFEDALRLDERNVAALLGLADAHVWEVNMYMSERRREQTRIAEAAALQALSLAPSSANVRCTHGTVLWAMGMPDRALREFELAITIDRNLAVAHAYSGWMKFYLGRFAETERHVAEARRLSPRDPLLFHWRYFVGSADLCLGRTVRAVSALRHSVELNSQWAFSHFVLAAALAQAGLLVDAAEAAAVGLRLAPQFTIAGLRRQTVGSNPIYLAQRDRLYEGLRIAGVPEE
ncbi:MAG: tetratricopeptide repeat protein [Alphaproteobacteria bacterium]|nr:tetratricopeptide repeat protein [Alphaproteobacteria bacterium]